MDTATSKLLSQKSSVLTLLNVDRSGPLNPHVSHVEKHILEWAEKFQITKGFGHDKKKLEAMQYGMLTARFYPFCSKEQLEVHADFMALFFCYDDLTDVLIAEKYESKLRKIEDRAIEILFGHPLKPNDHPLNVALHDIMQRYQALAPPSWVDRFAQDFRDFFHAIRWERLGRSEKTDEVYFSSYYLKRAYTGGCFPIFAMMGMMLPNGSSVDDVLNHWCVQQLRMLACNHVGWVNDILSMKREAARGIDDNLVMILKKERNISMAEALENAIRMCNRELLSINVLVDGVDDLVGTLEEDVKTYIHWIKVMVNGCMLWYEDTGRYDTQDAYQLVEI